MAAFNFPNSPSTNDTHTENGVTYKWNGTVWKRQNASYTDATNLNVTGISTLTGAVSFGGTATFKVDQKLYFNDGANNTFGSAYIYGDNYNLIVQNANAAGSTYLRGNTCNVAGGGSNKTGIRVSGSNGDVEFFHNNGIIGETHSNGEGGIDIKESLRHYGDTDTKIYFSAADTVKIQTGGTDRVTVTNATTTVANNLTVTGNLQVDGTNTVVNSTTMTVDDKNIVLGSGAANDAAADGGGVTLESGAGNKTWNWVDATDAWTSSEHIHLPDSKKLYLGGASGTYDGFELYHDGSNSYMKDMGTGELFIDGGAVNLRYGGNTKLSTTSTGIDVTGTITLDTVAGTNTNANLAVLFQTAADVIDGGSSLLFNPAEDTLKVNGSLLSSSSLYGSAGTLKLAAANHSSTSYVSVTSFVSISMATNKVVRFSGGIGEIGNVTGFQATNDANNALTSFGMRATDLRFATGSSERMRIDSNGSLLIGNSAATFSSPTPSLNIEKTSTGTGPLIFLYNGQSANTASTCEIRVGQNYREANRIVFGRENNSNWQASAGSVGSYMGFYTNSAGTIAERLRIGSTGNFGFATSNTSGYAGHTNLFIGGMGNLYAETSAGSGASLSINNNAYINSSGNWVYRTGGKATNIYHYNGDIGFRLASTGSANGTITWLERVRITDACFYVNSSNNSITNQPAFLAHQSSGAATYRPHSSHPIHHFYSNAGGTYSLESYVNGNGSYSDLSDYRLKENIVPISNGISVVKQLNPVKFDWKSSAKPKNDPGFIAHEVQALIPTAVDGTKDQVKEDGSPFYQAIAQAKIVPYLTAALKEAIAEIETLKTKVAALESS